MKETQAEIDYFELFGMAPRFRIDLSNLEQSFRRLQAELHPDRYASDSEPSRRISLQLSTKVNDAYRILRNPVSRTLCLINLSGKTGVVRDSAISPTFLMAQMEWREAIEEASTERNLSMLEALSRRLRHKTTSHEAELAIELDELGDFNKAIQRVNELCFYEKLRIDIDDAINRLDS